jgi:hypothetical protein
MDHLIQRILIQGDAIPSAMVLCEEADCEALTFP